MAAQKCIKNLIAEFFRIFECLLTQNPTSQGSQLSWFFYTIWKTNRKSKKQRALGNYFCLKMISKLAPQTIFQKIIQILEGQFKTSQILEIFYRDF